MDANMNRRVLIKEDYLTSEHWRTTIWMLDARTWAWTVNEIGHYSFLTAACVKCRKDIDWILYIISNSNRLPISVIHNMTAYDQMENKISNYHFSINYFTPRLSFCNYLTNKKVSGCANQTFFLDLKFKSLSTVWKIMIAPVPGI